MKFSGDLCRYVNKLQFSYLCHRQNGSLCDIKFRAGPSRRFWAVLVIAVKTAGKRGVLKACDSVRLLLVRESSQSRGSKMGLIWHFVLDSSENGP
jgi:hypothetical protein